MFSELLSLFRRTSSDSDDTTTVGDLLKEGEFDEKQLGSSVERRNRQLQRVIQGLFHCSYFVLMYSSSEPITIPPTIDIEKEERVVATLIDHMKRNESLIYLVQRRKEYINNRLKEIDKRLASMNPAPPRQRSSCVHS